MENTHRKLIELKDFLQNNSLNGISLTNLPQHFWETLGECIAETKPMDTPKPNKQKECERFICASILDFIDSSWDRVDKKKCEITQTKKVFLTEVKSNVETAIWVMTEVMSWGMDKNIYKEMIEYEDPEGKFVVLKLGGQYIKMIWNKDYTHTVSFAKEKTKVVTYFD